MEKEMRMKKQDKFIFSLNGLYESYGFSKYVMSKFEEYSLYQENRNFLKSEDVITFSGKDGKLMALRPDVTLSIVKSRNLSGGETEKLYYVENVYRKSLESGDFKELSQVGVESIGDVGEIENTETVILALKTLDSIDENFVLDLSHVMFIEGLIDTFNLKTLEDKQKVYALLNSKNMHDIEKLKESLKLSCENVDDFKALVSLQGAVEKVLSSARALVRNEKMAKAIEEIENIYSLVKLCGLADKIKLDFSIQSTAEYYNGIIFQGFVEKSNKAVLSGGRYDKLLNKFNKSCRAIGFALYLGEIEDYFVEDKTEYDIIVLYNDKTDKAQLIKEVENLRKEGKSVSLQRNIKGKYKKIEDKRC